jgi:hypothetical protein
MLNGEQPQQHKMVLMSTNECGFEEWYCPTCGRRFLMRWPPDYKKTILEPGDEDATHTGGRGLPGMEMNMGTSVNQPVRSEYLKEPEPVIDEEKLIPWEDWMEKVNFESLWDKPIQ